MHDLCFSLLSDFHITETGGGLQDFKAALAYHAKLRNDAVVFTGDILYQLDNPPTAVCYSIHEKNYDMMLEALNDAMPNTRRIVVRGNHEFAQQNNDPVLTERARAVWQDKIKQAEDGHEVINGYHVIYLSAPSWAMTPSPTREAWAEEQIMAAEKDGNKPIFLLTHGAHPAECGSLESVAYISDEFHEFMRKHPRLIHLFGHYHTVIQDEKSIRQDGYTAVSCPIGSVGFACLAGCDYRDPMIFGVSQSLYCTVDGNRVTLHRIDLHSETEYGTWVIDTDETVAGRWRYANRTAPVSEFAGGELTVEQADKLTVTIPQTFAGKEPVCYYRVEIGDAVYVKAANDFAYLSQGKPYAPTRTVHIPLPVPGRYTVKVFPENTYHQAGKPLTKEIEI